MPVIGIPDTTSTPGAPAADGTAPRVTRVFGTPVPERLRSVHIVGGTPATIRWTMVDADGAAIDLSPYIDDAAVGSLGGDDAFVRLRMLEAATGRDPATFAGWSPDPATGAVTATIDTRDLAAPGIYLAEMAVVDPAGVVLLANRFYVYADPSLFAGCPYAGPPALAEIRMMLRASSPGENRLLDNVPFDDAEVAQAVRMVVEYFNEAIPRIEHCFATTSFPWRYNWCRGAAALLFSMLAEYYRANQLPYAAGGITVDDFNKAMPYEAAYDKYWAEFSAWVRSTKATIAQDECWGTADSPYCYGYGYQRWQTY